MFKSHLLKVLGLSVALMSTSAHAMTLDWTGGYRVEWTEVDRPSLGSPTERKAYGLNYLYLSPKIIAADGINIISRFDVFNSNIYQNSQVGYIWGMNANDNAATAGNQGVADIKASQLYLNVNQEFGSLIVGRAPFEFGLGMMYSAGKGPFDHWYTTRDMAAYKIVVGDWFFMPLIGREYAADFGQGNNMTVMGAQLQYENTEAKSLIGVYMQQRKGAQSSLKYSDAQINAYTGLDASATPTGKVGDDLSVQSTSFVLGRGWDAFGFKIEAGFQSGATGVVNSVGQDVNLDGYGIAAEFYFPRKESKWDWTLKTGMATGYNGSTNFSGFAFNKNYDVAMLMFNHRLGQKDFFNTNAVKPQSIDSTTHKDTLSVGNSADDESIGNTFYLAPSVSYAWNDRFDVRNTVVYGQLLNTLQNSVDAKKDLGLEWDIELIYKPLERVQWVNQLGLLFPGDAWKNGNDNLGNDFTFGFSSKAAISF